MKKYLQTIFHGFEIKLKPMVLVLILPFLIMNADAQTKERKWNLGLLGGFSVYAGDLGNSMTDFTFDALRQNPLGGITVSRYLNRSFDFVVMGTTGSWGFYKQGVTIFKGNMLHGNLHLKYKLNNGYMISEDSRVAPYIFGGVGFSDLTGERINNSQDYPIVGGIGLRLRINDVLNVNYQATFGYMSTAHNNPQSLPYKIPTGNDQFMLHTLGINFNLGAGKDEDKDGIADKRDKCTGTPKGVKVDVNGCPFDTDGDGVMDFEDKCANQSGSVITKGCPDTDKDGLADLDDQCPNEAGTAEFNGCPDADGDGIIDKKDKCPNVKGTLVFDGCPDRDGDGIRDEEDLCPDVKGVASFKGCPDADEDGIEDSKDMCPTLKGPVATNGCPDTDNDGVNDGIDKCPALAGSPQHSGCPDTDNDGVFDDIDKCLTIPGTATNNGCPELKKEVKQLFQKALQGIQFETGKAVIKPVSFSILDAIVKVMKDNSTYKLLIGGHTDDVGDDEMNMTLSQDRSASVSNYLISHGVDPLRVTATGYGETKPVDTNKTDKGRARNRRVEFEVEFLQ
ncbi:MAG: OmpA family protein [Bacteroidia bacterium]|nr:OmpA family protein [Bacteroidia bacterium]